MARPHLPARVRSGASVWGTFVKLAGDEPIDLAAQAGFDFVVVDLEHSQLGEREARQQVRHGAAIGLPVLTRVAAVDAGLINRLLEAGAAGIQLAGVQHRHEVEALMAATRYPPVGRRSVSLAQPAADYGRHGLVDYLDSEQASPPLLVGQVESARTETALSSLVAGLDVVFIGPTDLSVDLGHPGQLDHPSLAARMGEIAAAAAVNQAVLGGWAGHAADARRLSALGARFTVVGSDLQLLAQALAEVRAGVAGPRPDEAR